MIVRSRLFRKYVGLFVAVVCLALLTNGLFEIWFYYRDHKAALIDIQHEQAEAAAGKIGQFVKEIEGQLGWTIQMAQTASTPEQRQFDALRLLRQVPAITEVAQLDGDGREKMRVSRIAVDAIGSDADFSKDPKFINAMANKIYYGPVYFRRESEPYMTLALAGAFRDAGVSVAEINLKFIWDLVSQIKVGRGGTRLRRRRAGPPHRSSRHQPRAAQHRPVRSCPGAGRPRRRWIDAPRPGASRQGHSRPPSVDDLCADPSPRLAGIRRAADQRGL